MDSVNNNRITPRMLGIGAIFIDDIVHPDGATYMGRLGGGVAHALMGAAVWDERPGISAIIGHDLPEAARQRLERYFDTTGLIQLDIPQIRAWQLFEENGLRRELYRVTDIAPFITGAQPEHLPANYHNSQAFYLLQNFDGIRAWRKSVRGIILWEPLQQIMIPGNRNALRAVLQECAIDIISPNLTEAQAIYGQLTADDLLDAMFDDGAPAVALRMGEYGSLVGCRSTQERYHVPAASTSGVIDQTGAGNTYCGAFLWGIMAGRNLLDAAITGAVAASFCIEQIGVLNPAEVTLEERNRRYHDLRNKLFDSASKN